MKSKRRTRKGFSLVEMIIVSIILSIITISCVLISNTVSAIRIRARNNILLTNHNLNVMESLRQEMYRIGVGEKLEVYYGFDDDDDEYDSMLVANNEASAWNTANPDATPRPLIDLDDTTSYRLNFSTYNYQLVPSTTHLNLPYSGATIKDMIPVPNTGDIRTDVFLDISEWDNFHIYNVRIESTVMGYAQQLTNSYILTDIGTELNPIMTTP